MLLFEDYKCKQYNLKMILIFLTLYIASMQIKLVEKIEMSLRSFSAACWQMGTDVNNEFEHYHFLQCVSLACEYSHVSSLHLWSIKQDKASSNRAMTSVIQ